MKKNVKDTIMSKLLLIGLQDFAGHIITDASNAGIKVTARANCILKSPRPLNQDGSRNITPVHAPPTAAR